MLTSVAYILLACMASAPLCSCSGSTLSKGEAKKQLDMRLQQEAPTFKFQTLFKNDDVTRRWGENGKNAGFFTYETASLGNQQMGQEVIQIVRLTLLDKVRPFIVSQTDKQYSWYGVLNPFSDIEARAGTLTAEIVSMTVPANDQQGRIVCTVQYKIKYAPNELSRVFEQNIQSFRAPGAWGVTENDILSATFVKMQDGWIFSER